MNTYTFDEAKKTIIDGDYKRIAFFDAENEKLIGYNNQRTPLEEKLTQIEKRLASPGLPDGYYYIMAKHDTKSKGDKLHIQKGDTMSEPAPEPARKQDEVKPAISISEIIQLHGENARLSAQIDRLTEKNEELQLENEQLNEQITELEEQAEQLAENDNGEKENNGHKWLEQLMEGAIPVIDRVLDVQEKKIQANKEQWQAYLNAKNGVSNHSEQPGVPGQGSEGAEHDEIEAGRQAVAELSNEQRAKIDQQLADLKESNPEMFNAEIEKLTAYGYFEKTE